MNVMNI